MRGAADLGRSVLHVELEEEGCGQSFESKLGGSGPRILHRLSLA